MTERPETLTGVIDRLENGWAVLVPALTGAGSLYATVLYAARRFARRAKATPKF